MKSIIDRETIKSVVSDSTKEPILYNDARRLFLEAKSRYKDSKKVYNKIKQQKLMRMNRDAFKTLEYLYRDMREARDNYYTTKHDLNLVAIDTFAKAVTVKLTKKELGALVAKLMTLYEKTDWKDDKPVTVSFYPGE